MEGVNEGELFPEPKRGFSEILKSYFYWTYPRGMFSLRRDGDADSGCSFL